MKEVTIITPAIATKRTRGSGSFRDRQNIAKGTPVERRERQEPHKPTSCCGIDHVTMQLREPADSRIQLPSLHENIPSRLQPSFTPARHWPFAEEHQASFPHFEASSHGATSFIQYPIGLELLHGSGQARRGSTEGAHAHKKQRDQGYGKPDSRSPIAHRVIRHTVPGHPDQKCQQRCSHPTTTRPRQEGCRDAASRSREGKPDLSTRVAAL